MGQRIGIRFEPRGEDRRSAALDLTETYVEQKDRGLENGEPDELLY